MIKLLLRRFLVFWGVMFIAFIIAAMAAIILTAIFPHWWLFWVSLIVGVIVGIAISWLTGRLEWQGEGE